jgi:hypothetical protein
VFLPTFISPIPFDAILGPASTVEAASLNAEKLILYQNEEIYFS